jgi:hypothetical protein
MTTLTLVLNCARAPRTAAGQPVLSPRQHRVPIILSSKPTQPSLRVVLVPFTVNFGLFVKAMQVSNNAGFLA